MPKQAPTRSHPLENVFDISHDGFRHYMGIGGVHDVPKSVFVELAADMGKSTHPLVLYAAGSALAEGAHYSQSSNRSSRSNEYLYARLGHLEEASKYWLLARHGFARQKEEATDDKMRAEWFYLEARASQLLAAKPSLRVLTHWACGREVELADVEEATSASMRLALAAGGVLTRHLAQDLYMRRAKNGILSELGAELLLQRGTTISNLVVPTSLRQDHHRKATYRADLMAVSCKVPHQRTLIQVGPSHIKTRNIRALHIKTEEDLVFDTHKPGRSVLYALLEANGGNADSVIVERLDEMSYKLVKKLISKRHRKRISPSEAAPEADPYSGA